MAAGPLRYREALLPDRHAAELAGSRLTVFPVLQLLRRCGLLARISYALFHHSMAGTGSGARSWEDDGQTGDTSQRQRTPFSAAASLGCASPAETSTVADSGRTTTTRLPRRERGRDRLVGHTRRQRAKPGGARANRIGVHSADYWPTLFMSMSGGRLRPVPSRATMHGCVAQVVLPLFLQTDPPPNGEGGGPGDQAHGICGAPLAPSCLRPGHEWRGKQT